MTEERSDRFKALEERYAGYEVYDPQGKKIGKVDDLFVDENDEPEYIGVKMGLFGLKSTLIPARIITNVDEERRAIEVSESEDRVKNAPTFDDDEEITPEHEERVYRHFGLERAETSEKRGGYGSYYSDSTPEARPGVTTNISPGYREKEAAGGGISEEGHFSHSEEGRPDADSGDRDRGESRDYPDVSVGDRDREEHRERSPEVTAAGPEGAPTDAGAEQRESGGLRVRKRLRTDREQIQVPIKREEARVEQGSDGELRIRKEVVEDEKTIEVDVNKEEVDVEDEGELGRR